MLAASPITHRLRGESYNTGFSRMRDRLATWLESPIGQSLSELHTVAFLYGGRYLELGRRITGMSYVSLKKRARLMSRSPLQRRDKSSVHRMSLWPCYFSCHFSLGYGTPASRGV